MSTVLIIVLVLIVGVILVVAILGVLAWSGMRRYATQAKTTEGRSNVGALARGIVTCTELGSDDPLADSPTRHGLPPTSPKVPASLSQVRGDKYSSQPADWTARAFTCSSFSIPVPQYFQYQWVLETPDRKGTARAEADLDGDGAIDVTLEQDVECVGSADSMTCKVGPLREKL